jgi:TonB family protein
MLHGSGMVLGLFLFAVSALAETQLGNLNSVRKIRDVKPSYPREALQAGDEGWVIVAFRVMPSGAVGESQVVASQCKRLESAALAAVRQWRFEPVLENGTPVPFLQPPPFRSACRPSSKRVLAAQAHASGLSR